MEINALFALILGNTLSSDETTFWLEASASSLKEYLKVDLLNRKLYANAIVLYAVYLYNNKNKMNILKYKEGNLEITYADTKEKAKIPPEIIAMLPYPKARFV